MKNSHPLNILIIIICIIILVLILILILISRNDNKDSQNKDYSQKINNPLSQLRICGTGNEGDKGRCEDYNDSNDKYRLKGISVTAAIWNKKTLPDGILAIAFLNDPPVNFKKTFEKCDFLDDGSIVFPKDHDFVDGSSSLDYIGAKFDPLEKVLKNTKNIKQSIMQIIRERYCVLTGIDIVEVPNWIPNYVRQVHITINFDSNNGSWSALGSKSMERRPSMNFAWFDVGTVLHEFGHAFGLLHEHQSPYKIPFFTGIDWNKPELYAWAKRTQGWDEAKVNEQIINPLSIFEVRGTWYDSESIMLYFFPGILTKDKKGTRQNRRLSKIDVTYIYSLYNFDSVPRKTPEDFYREVYNEYITPKNVEICV
jgi:hypothetical protein